jgi:hypothetical protein
MIAARPRPARWVIGLAVLSLAVTGLTVLLPGVERARNSYRELRADESVRGLEHIGDLDRKVTNAASSMSAADVRRAVPAAQELLQNLPAIPAWYHGRGNAMHYTHVVLGRQALVDGKLDCARAELLEAGKTSGSIQLSAFGPDMTLAQELLERGEAKTVQEYLTECRGFWADGRPKLLEWSQAISRGQQPNFGSHSGYSRGPSERRQPGA